MKTITVPILPVDPEHERLVDGLVGGRDVEPRKLGRFSPVAVEALLEDAENIANLLDGLDMQATAELLRERVEAVRKSEAVP